MAGLQEELRRESDGREQLDLLHTVTLWPPYVSVPWSMYIRGVTLFKAPRVTPISVYSLFLSMPTRFISCPPHAFRS